MGEVHPVAAQHQNDFRYGFRIFLSEVEKTVLGCVQHPSLCPTIKELIDRQYRHQLSIFRLEQGIEVIPQQVAEVPNHIVRTKNTINDDFSITRIR